jgi:hypothetical protein
LLSSRNTRESLKVFSLNRRDKSIRLDRHYRALNLVKDLFRGVPDKQPRYPCPTHGPHYDKVTFFPFLPPEGSTRLLRP